MATQTLTPAQTSELDNNPMIQRAAIILAANPTMDFMEAIKLAFEEFDSFTTKVLHNPSMKANINKASDRYYLNR